MRRFFNPANLLTSMLRPSFFTPKDGGGYTASTTTLPVRCQSRNEFGPKRRRLDGAELAFQLRVFSAPAKIEYSLIRNGNLTFGSSDASIPHFNYLYGGGRVGALFTSPGDASTVLDDFAVSLPRIAPLWQDFNPWCRRFGQSAQCGG
jgi:hypothetical protein